MKQIEFGKWYLDGFCVDQIITPFKSDNHILRYGWRVIKRCESREQAEKEIEKFNENRLPSK